jgi:magnesium and cobalt transporter
MQGESTESPRPSWYSRLRKLLKAEAASRDDLRELLGHSRWREVLDKNELAMLQGVLQVSQMQVRDVMVPRSHMVVLEHDAPMAELLRTIIDRGHSRFPVIGEDRDEVLGILLAKDVLRFFVESPGEQLDVEQSLRPATFIPESKRLDALLQEFRISRNHIAIVVDEYGGTAGLLTIEDVLEQIVGDIDDEHDPEEVEPIQERDGDRYQVLALTRIEDFNEYFGVHMDDLAFDTVGGLVMHEFGRLPRRGESIAIGGIRFEVIQADQRRIHSFEIIRESEPVHSE